MEAYCIDVQQMANYNTLFASSCGWVGDFTDIKRNADNTLKSHLKCNVLAFL